MRATTSPLLYHNYHFSDRLLADPDQWPDHPGEEPGVEEERERENKPRQRPRPASRSRDRLATALRRALHQHQRAVQLWPTLSIDGVDEGSNGLFVREHVYNE